MTPKTGNTLNEEQFKDIFKDKFYLECTYLGEPTMAAATKSKVKAKKKKREIFGGLAKAIQHRVKPKAKPVLPTFRYSGCDYMQPVLQHTALPHVVDSFVKAMKNVDFEGIAFRGFSGAILAGAVAARIKKPLILVRKGPGADNTHSGFAVEGSKVHSYVIIDDLISSGKTIEHILSSMEDFCCNSKCKMIFLYDKNEDRTSFTANDGTKIEVRCISDWTNNATLHY